MKKRIYKYQKIFEYISLLIVAVLLLSPILYFLTYKYEISDINFHTVFASKFFEVEQQANSALIAHSAWQLSVIFFQTLISDFIGKSWKFSAFMVTLFTEILTVLIIFFIIRKKSNFLFSSLVSLSLMIIQPIIIMAFIDQHISLGYIWINSYQNPTSYMLKPFALLQTYISIEALSGKQHQFKEIFLLAVSSIIAVFSKPSFAICLLPGLFILIIWNYFRKIKIDIKTLIFGVFIPSVFFLLWQYFSTYGLESDSHVIFAPFLVMSKFSSYLFLKFFLSITFPFIVTVLSFKKSINDIRMQFGWIIFAVGVFLTYFFAETGWRLVAGNFTWSGQISLFILFFCCFLYIIENQHIYRKKAIVYFTYALHLISGIYVYLITFTKISPPNPFA